MLSTQRCYVSVFMTAVVGCKMISIQCSYLLLTLWHFPNVQHRGKKSLVDSFFKRWVRYCSLSTQTWFSELSRPHVLYLLAYTLFKASIFMSELASWGMVSIQCSFIELSQALFVYVFIHTFAHASIFMTEDSEIQHAFLRCSFLHFSIWHFPYVS